MTKYTFILSITYFSYFMTYFVTAIGTDSGKTLVSAILAEALQADYWKPVQAGLPRDTETVESLLTNSVSTLHTEAYLLTNPLSPHAAAQLDNIEIDLQKIKKPKTDRILIVEGAGGVLVPLNDRDFVIDIAEYLQAEVILVANLYLGSINHTLLTIKELRRREKENNLRIRGIIFTGCPVISSEEIILKHCPYPCLLHIAQEEIIDKATVLKYAKLIDRNKLIQI
jgi:dethiobiotin synthetase